MIQMEHRIDIFSDDFWLVRELELSEFEERRRRIIETDSFWGPLPGVTDMEIEWDKIRLDVLEQVAKVLRDGEEFDAYVLARSRAESLDLTADVYEESDGHFVMPSMIAHYIDGIDVPRMMSSNKPANLGAGESINIPKYGDEGFD